MGNLTHTVSGDIASFRSAARVPIESLKCHFLPIQEGTGDPSPDNVRPISGWQGVEIYQDDIYLPKEYQRIEYLEATGKQYIYTNIPIQSPFTIDADFMYTSNTGDQCLICAGYNQDNRNIRIGAFGLYGQNLQNYYSGYWYAGTIYPNLRYKMRAQLEEGLQITTNSGIEINRATRRHNSTDIPIDKTRGNFGIFCMYRNQAPVYYCYVKLYSMKLYGETDSIVGNFIPCYRKSDNKPGMYDTVSQTFFTNQGTGEFICGPDCGTTIPITFPVLGKNKFPNPTGEICDIDLIEGQTYTISATAQSVPYFKAYYDDDTDSGLIWLDQTISDTRYSRTFIPSKHVKRGYYYLDTYGVTECQIELGDTATEYWSYNSNNTVYSGYIDPVNGVLVQNTIHRIIGSANYATTINKNNAGLGYIIYYLGQIFGDVNVIDKSKIIKSNYFKQIEYTSPNNITEPWVFIIAESRNYIVFFGDTTLTSQEAWNNFFTTSGTITLVASLNTPITYKCSKKNLNTYLDQNYIWSNTNDITEVSYAVHDSTMIRSTKKQIIGNEPHIETASDTVATFNTDIATPLKECKIYFNPIQEGSGDPSLDNIRPISGWTNIDLTHTQKSIVPFLTNSFFSQGKYQTYTGWCDTWKIPDRTKQYIYSVYIDNTYGEQDARAIVWYRNKDDTGFIGADISNTIEMGTSGRASITIDLTQSLNVYYIQFGLAIKNATASNPMVEIGNVNTIYESYNGSNLLLNWQNDIGTVYGGYVDLIRSQIYSDYYQLPISSLTSTNVHKVSRFTDYDVYYFDMTNLDVIPASNADIPNMFFENYKVASWDERLNNPRAGIVSATTMPNGTIRIQIFTEKDAYETVEDFIVSFTNRILLFKRQTPIIQQFTPQQLKTLQGINNIWSNSNGPIEIKYWTH